MAITRDRFDEVRRRYGDVGSWAVWADARPGHGVKDGVGDLSVLDADRDDEVLETLRADVVMLGINGSGAPTPASFSNFHDPSSRANHFKLRHAYRGTPFWGAYLTDAFKGIESYGAKRTIAFLRAHPPLVREQLARLDDELATVGCDDPLVIVFGADVFGLLREHWHEGARMVRVPHYAHYLSKEDYRAQALRAIDEYLVAGPSA
ncbi:hypothetical protein PU630_08630 [Microbacterium horticulturae]|uniref:Uracil DNA glycosylase superfamily protein n=1 Tax=Microbacterium horticulturae TaxID=3028316 RepID=A0ABY8C2A6_9MICO|nr:hypothetical protein [Microbacterium sp. KACC 23027]WEG10586.1 hypothetical protein PU630_08630 [Microbacterium sp. KACC 23027]